MALFQKRPQSSNPSMFFSVGLNKTVLLVGLGNPGKEYDLTRHNIGFYCLDNFVAKNHDMQPWIDKKDLKCQLSSGQLGDVRVLAIKPQTFMNLSGEAVEAVIHFYKISPDQLLVIQDELDVNFGQIRVRKGGSAAGHNGIKSLIDMLGDDFSRLRVGIGPLTPENIKSESFVLAKFSEAEQRQLPNMAIEVNALLSERIVGGELPNETRSFIV